jgi:hypothetical protein
MKNKFAVALLALLSVFLALPAFGQKTLNPVNQESYATGWYSAPAYNYQTSVFSGGATAGGTYSVSVFEPFVVLKDKRIIFPFSTTIPITIGQGAARETVTPSSVSNCSNTVNPAGTRCSITATFANAHGKGDVIVSGDNGIQEAIADARRNGGGNVYFEQDCGNVTMNTGGATTTTSGCTIPSIFVSLGASTFVTTTITTTATYNVGTSTDTAAFVAGNCSRLLLGSIAQHSPSRQRK